MYKDVWDGAASRVSRVKVSGLLSRSDVSYCVTRARSLLSCSNLLVARVKWITAHTASMFGAQSSVFIADLPPSKREKSSSLYTSLRSSAAHST